MAKKGQTFQHYPESVKREAIRLREVEKWTNRAITEHLGIHDINRVKRWVRVYREQGERVFEDRRGNPHRVQTEESRTIKHMEMENAVLKKWLEILSQEVSKRNSRSLKR
ncbi:helix-turn-helix domain-containing protein [Tumebacillus permanentifrigoris]|uniref:Helix-turn-helix protein n=1 Tax=Tumebacillus permanentifrigoris TaxID=378543 RepID=A0A316D201_9BACL|nr:helix-turn-helix domain-containing protein [Tumebacillus permanentifrigoris]PWJ98495.1 helix-turn-helix protein [Tumebacillus permanentifrigoris]